ncbi:MAG: ABC transporter [Treponema sp.]|nr:MAG: ABC transporter [Treponema sp.]
MIDKELYKFCGKARRYIFLLVTVNLASLIAGINFAYLMARIVFGLFNKEPMKLNFFILLAVILCLKFILIKQAAYFKSKIINEVKHKLRFSVYNKVLEIGVSYQDVMTTQEVTQLGVEGVEQLENYFGGYLPQFYYCFIAAAFLFGAIAPLDLRSAIILMIASLTIPLSLQAIMGLVRKTQRKYWRKYADVGNLFLDSLTGLTTLKIFQSDKQQAEAMDVQAEGFRKQTMRVLGMQLNSIMIIDWIAYGSTAIVIALAVMRFASANLNLFSIIAIILLSAEFFVPMRILTSLFHVAMTGVAAGEQILKFLNTEKPKLHDGIKLVENSKIELKNFSYIYPDGTVALKNINADISLNGFTAIVGQSGCGKSTLSSAMTSLLKNKAVRINHNPHIFAGTVRENVTMGNKNIDDETIIAVLEKLELMEFLNEKQGLNTELLQGGKNISGGQIQRIAIATALLSNFEVYIFDEATSNVDVESEEIILKIIKELSLSRTVIYISHKMKTAALADFIYVMQAGEIIETGKHNELMQKNGVYFNLYTEQERLLNFNDMQGGKNED